jgi:hypothetical protein
MMITAEPQAVSSRTRRAQPEKTLTATVGMLEFTNQEAEGQRFTLRRIRFCALPTLRWSREGLDE